VAATDHPAQRHPDVVEAVAEWIEDREPDWMVLGMDETVDQVVRHGVSVRPDHDHLLASAITAIIAANGRVIVPAAVRMEAGWRRRDPAAAGANRLVSNTPRAERISGRPDRDSRRGAGSVDAPCAPVEVPTSDVAGRQVARKTA
jgi:hypothetical protein